MKYLYSFFNWEDIGQNGTYLSREIQKNEILKQVMLPATPGCYVWKHNNNVLYIGRSSNIQSRLGAHIFSKISRPRSNAIFSTTARDTVIRFYSKADIEVYRNLSKEEKSSTSEYISHWNELMKIINESSFVIYSTRDSLDSFNLERELIKDLKPITNNGIPNTIRQRDDFKVLGFKN